MAAVGVHARDVFDRRLTDLGYRVTREGRGLMRVSGRRCAFCLYVAGVAGLKSNAYPNWAETRITGLAPDRLVGVAIFPSYPATRDVELYVVPTLDWHAPDRLLVNPQYEDDGSPPEYGIRLSKSGRELFRQRYLWHGDPAALPCPPPS